MDANSRVRDQIPEEFGTIEAAAAFWDTHSLADYWDQTEEVALAVALDRRIVLLPLEQGLAKRLSEVARNQGLSAETLANLWLSERLQEAASASGSIRLAENREEYRAKDDDSD